MNIDGFFAFLFGKTPDHELVRRDIEVKMTSDCDGNPVIDPVRGTAFLLSSDGSIDKVSVLQDRYYHCGHSADTPLGGMCGEPGCGKLSCTGCFSRCSVCRKPLCCECSHRFVIDGTTERDYCSYCLDETIRRLRIRRVTDGLIAGATRLLTGKRKA